MRKLSPNLKSWLEVFNGQMEKLRAGGFVQTPTNAREGLATLTWSLITVKPEIEWIQDDLVHGDEFDVPVRMYSCEPESKLPVLVYFHGGGHMSGSVTVYDPICRKLARATGHIVVAADYRLAPECPYPAGINDALTVVKNLWKTLDRRKVNYLRQLSIAGDSAGGAISATVSHLTQHDTDIDIKKQVLIYPSLDYTLQLESVAENGTGYLLEKDKIEWYLENYFQNNENRKEHSPLHMEFSESLPQSLVLTAEFCPLRDEGRVYAEKLDAAGVPATRLHFDDMIHAFVNMEDLTRERCEEVYRSIATFLQS